MNDHDKIDFYLHSIMCLVGGFLGAYALFNRGGNLGSAQTANLISIVFCLLGNNLEEFTIRLVGLFLYFLGIELYVHLSHKESFNIKRYGIVVNMVGIIVLSFIPSTSDPVIGLLPLFFMMSTQWSIFHGTCGYNSSTIFSTNNFRQLSLAIGEYLHQKDDKHIAKAKFFANSLFWYHLGVAISFICCLYLGTLACLLCFIPTFIAFIITLKSANTHSLT